MMYAPASRVFPVDCSGAVQQLYVLALQSPRLPLVAATLLGAFFALVGCR